MSDLISRQAAIEALKGMAVPLYKDPACEDIWERDRTLDNAIDAIRGLPSAQPEQRWIPCSERLPEEGEDIIVTYVDDEETRIIPVNYDKRTWYDCIFDTALNPIKVIAWMPLPEPYKEEQE